MSSAMARRTFLRRITVGGGGLALGMWLTACTEDESGSAPTSTASATTSAASTSPPAPTTTAAADPSARFEPHLLLRIDGDETVTVTVPKVEMGQGVRTSLAMIVAEELDADWATVRVASAPADRAYGDQVTGGSLSVSSRFDSLRRIGAAARHMLIAAAAGLWGIEPEDCGTEPGVVVERDGDRRATYGALAGIAAGLEPPPAVDIIVKDPADFRIIGTARSSVDAPDIVTGAAIYGFDIVVPDLTYAVVARSPVFGGAVLSYDDAAARLVPGVLDVIPTSTGVAVVAESTWAALQGRDALDIEWDSRGNDANDDASIRRGLTDRLDPATLGQGDLTADYTFPYLAHAAMEPLACVAGVSGDTGEVWAGTQDPQLARAVAAHAARLPTESVTLHVPLIGGGFGRRLDQDFVADAAEIAAVSPRPVKLLWSRTDDLRHDRYHPAGVTRVTGNPADPGRLQIQEVSSRNGPVPTGDWRSVSNAPAAFARESFLDELAAAAGSDPYEYRRRLLDGDALASLDAAADAAGWGRPLPDGWGRGIAHHETWDVSPTTAVVEVEVEGDAIRVHRAVLAIACGIVVNPDMVAAQMEGAVAFAMSAALLPGVTIVGGGVVESNFHDSPILRFDAMPEVETHIVATGGRPTGVGEAGVPPIAPAIANAVFAATGRRLRDLPLRLG